MPRAKKEIVPQKSSIEKEVEKGGEKGGEKKSSSKSDPKVMKEYFRLQREYFLSHGPRIFLLMQIGAFYEIYGIRMKGAMEKGAMGLLGGSGSGVYESWEEKEEFNRESLMTEFLELTDYKKMEKGQCMDGKEVVGAGFRDYQLEEQLAFLTKSGYTVVVFSQKETKKDGVQERELYGIFSPGTYVSGIEGEMGMGLGGKLVGRTTNHVMCIWSEVFSKARSGKKSGVGENTQRLVIGVSVMNMFSGQSFVLEYEKSIETRWIEGAVKYIYSPSLFDELERYVYTYQPNETLIIGSMEGVEAVLDYTGLRNTCPMNHLLIDSNVAVSDVSGAGGSVGNGGGITKEEKMARCKKMKYIQAVLGSVFGEKTVAHCSEWDYYVMATRSFCYLLDFIAEHRPELIRKVCIPVFHNTTDRVILANHTLQQLNILEVEDAKGWLEGVGGVGATGGSGGNLRSVVGFLNRALTPMGKRRVQEALVSPTFNETVLEREYGMVDRLLEEDGRSGVIDRIREGLRGIRDIERISRQLLLGKLCPGVLYNLYISLEKIIGIQTHLVGKMPKYWQEGVMGEGMGVGMGEGDMGGKLLKYISFRVDLDACRGINSMNFVGYSPVIWNEEIERMTREILEKEALFIQAMEDCNAFLGQDWVHLKKTEKGQWSLETTKLRGKQMQNKIDETVREGGVLKVIGEEGSKVIDMNWMKELRIVKQGSSESMVAITNEELTKASTERMELLERRTGCMVKLYQDFLVEFCNKWYDVLIGYGRYAGNVDVLQCKAYLAREYHYCRPRIMEERGYGGTGEIGENGKESSLESSDENGEEQEEEKGGRICAKGLRHVLIEHLQQREIYVANDICLGEGSKEGSGWLVYGTNAVGKTSLIRAVGIAIIMAQAGFYVPCVSFDYRPYHAIYTRILGNDNLFKGMSSFDVEMSELRVILREANSRSLVLGDELCSGTEMESALSIFVASLEHLVSIRSSFLFATHFHEIVYYSEIEKMKNSGGIGLKHLTVHYDAETGKLVYDRRLKEGAGSALYGLEVCKSLYLPVAFIDRAYEIRKKYGGGIGGRGNICRTRGGDGNASGSEDGEEGSMIRLEDDVSVYNSLKIRGVCERCHKEIGEEVHHIVPQKKANKRGMIVGEKGEVFHKNHKANLMAVCHACHLLEHGGNFSS
jgi:DNA mismatch repair protein MutS